MCLSAAVDCSAGVPVIVADATPKSVAAAVAYSSLSFVTPPLKVRTAEPNSRTLPPPNSAACITWVMFARTGSGAVAIGPASTPWTLTHAVVCMASTPFAVDSTVPPVAEMSSADASTVSGATS